MTATNEHMPDGYSPDQMQIFDPELSAVTDTTATFVFSTRTGSGDPAGGDVEVRLDPAGGGRVRRVSSAGDDVDKSDGVRHLVVEGLDPETEYRIGFGAEIAGEVHELFLPKSFTTLRRPPGELLSSVATVSDMHFGEKYCGLGPKDAPGPVFRAADEQVPYWLHMNKSILAEINEYGVDRVVVKGDITSESQLLEFTLARGLLNGLNAPWDAILGNHDMMDPLVDGLDEIRQPAAPARSVDIEGCKLVLIDTNCPGKEYGMFTPERAEALESELGAAGDNPVFVFGHHYVSDPAKRGEYTFGIDRTDSARLLEVLARGRDRPIGGYFAGHTHRNRVRKFAETGSMPLAEVCSTKEYPGGWALYRIYEGGYTQEVRRCAAPRALAWCDKTKEMFGGYYRLYAIGKLGERCFAREW